MSFSKRDFVKGSIGLICAGAFPAGAQTPSPSATRLVTRVQQIPKLFCVAYITPDAKNQQGQEAAVAKYPLAIVAQDTRRAFVEWRQTVKALNPSIVMLGYQVVIEETLDPGPGHDHLRLVKNAWATYPGGYLPTVNNGPGTPQRRIFDPRSAEWRKRFLDACSATMASYPYDGLFLDQCSVFPKAHPFPWIRAEMEVALQDTLLELRKRFPTALLVGNTAKSWRGLNGEMNENRLPEAPPELLPFSGHVEPRLEMVLDSLKTPNDIANVRRNMEMAHRAGAFYGASVDFQHVLWLRAFDRVIAGLEY